MENENGNRYGTGEGQGPDYHTGNREPVIVAEQPAREVTDEDSGQASAGQDGSDGWSSPVDAPLQEDRWSETGHKPYLGSPWEPTQSGASYDTGKGNGVSGNDSQPVYKPAPASYGQSQPGTNQSLPGANQGQPGINQGQPGTGRGGDFSQNDSHRERGGGQPGGNSQYQSQYQTQYQTQYQSFQPAYQEKNNMATASLVMGILSLCSICCCMLFGVVFGVLGIIFAIMSKKGDRMDSQAKAGLILSIIGVAATVLIIIFFVVIEVLAVIPELN